MSESLKAHPLLRQWLGLSAAGQVQAFSGKVDLGQGISHALRLIVAQELRLSPAHIDMVPASTHTSPDEAVTCDAPLRIGEKCAGYKWHNVAV
jgi:nicotinate dehydrogenase subunit B